MDLSAVGWPPSMVRLNHHVGPAQMAAVVRLPTISDGAAHLDASCLHVAGKSAQWLFGDSLPTNRQVGIRDLFDFFWSVEQGHINCRRVYVLDFRPFAAFIRPDATSTAVEWFISMDLVQCTARSVTVVGGGANPPGSPGFRARRLQPLLDERVVAQVRIHPSQRRPLARPCAHTDCRFRLSRSCRPSPGYCMGYCLGRAWALLPPQSLLDVPALAAAGFPSVAW